ncbi:hypothetical protein WN943_017675 [Citrus x changshan-huyou]
MGRTPCCDKKGLKKGPWAPEEDEILVEYIKRNGHGSWRSLPKLAGLLRCGKSCRLRWTNYLRPDIKRGPFTEEEEKLVIQLHGILGNRESLLFNTPSMGKTDSDHFLRMWNSEVGESFRKFNKGVKTACQSPNSQVSSSTKCGSVSAVSTEIGHNLAGSSATPSNQNEDTECKSSKSCTEDMVAGSDTSSSNDLQDSSDSSLQLLLDFPINNDMSFLEDNYFASSAMFTGDSLICPL